MMSHSNERYHDPGPVPGAVFWDGPRTLVARGCLCFAGCTFWVVEFEDGDRTPWPLTRHEGLWYGRPPGSEPLLLGVVPKIAEGAEVQ